MTDAPTHPNAGLFRRLAAMLYDGLLLLAIYMSSTAALLLLTGGEPFVGHLRLYYQLFLLAIGLGFFAMFWHFGGQTLGMRAWRLQVRGAQGPLSWQEAWLRAACSLVSWASLGVGYLWSLVDRERLAWHDRLSGTRLIVIPKKR